MNDDQGNAQGFGQAVILSGSDAVYFGVLLYNESLHHLEPLASRWVKHSQDHHYLVAKSVDTSGAYLHMVIEDDNPDDAVIDIDLYIPHHFVRAIIHMNGLRRIGFV